MSNPPDTAAVLDLVTNVAEVGTWDWNRVTGEVWWNTWHERLLAYEHRVGPRTYEEFRVRVHPDDIEPLERDVARAVETGALYQNRFRIVLPDGTVRHLRGQGRVLEGQPDRMVGVLVDVTTLVDAVDRERDLLRSLHEADRRARLSFAADIHDGPLQRLFAAHLSAVGARTALGDVGAVDARVATRLERCVEAIEDAQRSLRALLGEMHREPDGEGADVLSYIEQLAEEMFAERHEQVVVRRSAPVSVAWPLLPEVLSIAREAMQNIAKHARATTVTIGAETTSDGAEISIVDDGVGFGPGATTAAGHYGVRTMTHRAAVIGGRLTAESHPGAGTAVRLSLPHPGSG